MKLKKVRLEAATTSKLAYVAGGNMKEAYCCTPLVDRNATGPRILPEYIKEFMDVDAPLPGEMALSSARG